MSCNDCFPPALNHFKTGQHEGDGTGIIKQSGKWWGQKLGKSRGLSFKRCCRIHGRGLLGIRNDCFFISVLQGELAETHSMNGQPSSICCFHWFASNYLERSSASGAHILQHGRKVADSLFVKTNVEISHLTKNKIRKLEPDFKMKDDTCCPSCDWDKEGGKKMVRARKKEAAEPSLISHLRPRSWVRWWWSMINQS